MWRPRGIAGSEAGGYGEGDALSRTVWRTRGDLASGPLCGRSPALGGLRPVTVARSAQKDGRALWPQDSLWLPGGLVVTPPMGHGHHCFHGLGPGGRGRAKVLETWGPLLGQRLGRTACWRKVVSFGTRRPGAR